MFVVVVGRDGVVFLLPELVLIGLICVFHKLNSQNCLLHQVHVRRIWNIPDNRNFHRLIWFVKILELIYIYLWMRICWCHCVTVFLIWQINRYSINKKEKKEFHRYEVSIRDGPWLNRAFSQYGVIQKNLTYLFDQYKRKSV
jgi:hypothetical protein